MLLFILLGAAALVPSLLLVVYFHRRDVYPEPPAGWRGNAARRVRVQSGEMTDTELEPSRPGQRTKNVGRWAAIVLSGPLLVLALIRIDWSFLGGSFGELELSAEFLVEELVISFKLTLLAIVSLLVFRCLFPHNRQTRSVAVLLPMYLWGFEAALLDRMVFFSSGSWTPHFLLFLLWLVPAVTFSALALVLLSGVLHSCVVVWDGSGGERRTLEIGLRTALLAGVVVTTSLLDLLLFSVVIGEWVATRMP